MTKGNDQKLRIDMWDFEGKYRFAEYRTFRISNEAEKYKLHLSGYRGTASI